MFWFIFPCLYFHCSEYSFKLTNVCMIWFIYLYIKPNFSHFVTKQYVSGFFCITNCFFLIEWCIMLFWIIPSVHVGFLLRMIHVLEHKLRELYGFLRHLTSVGDKYLPPPPSIVVALMLPPILGMKWFTSRLGFHSEEWSLGLGVTEVWTQGWLKFRTEVNEVWTS